MHFHGPVANLLVETGGLMNNAAIHHRFNGGATPPTSAVGSTSSMGKRHTNMERRRATKKWGKTMHGRRQTVRVRLATRRGDVVRLIIWKGGSVGGS
jgi:hypothetical protein